MDRNDDDVIIDGLEIFYNFIRKIIENPDESRHRSILLWDNQRKLLNKMKPYLASVKMFDYLGFMQEDWDESRLNLPILIGKRNEVENLKKAKAHIFHHIQAVKKKYIPPRLLNLPFD